MVRSTIPGGLSYKCDGDACWKIKIKPVRDDQSVCGPSFINWLDWRFLCGQCHGIFCKFIYAQPWAIPKWANNSDLRPKHFKRDQSLHFTPLSETMSIPITFIWESPPEVRWGANDVLKLKGNLFFEL